MIINFVNFLSIIKKNFLRIISVSLFISLLLSYFFFNISKTTVSKIEIKISEDYNNYDNLIVSALSLEDFNITHVTNKKLINEYLTKIKNFSQYKDKEYSQMLETILNQLDSSTIIRKNNKSKRYLSDNRIIYDQIIMSTELKNEIEKIINSNIENFLNRLNSELNSLRLIGITKDFEQNYEDYLENFKIFKSNPDDLFNYKSFCLVKCYNIKLNLTQKQIDKSYQYEVENKKEIEFEYFNLKEKLELLNKVLISIDTNKYKNNYTLEQSRAAPMISFYEFFLFIFLISISLVSIFVLFKKSFDEEN